MSNDDVFSEAANNMRAMHDVNSILNNDDIPVDSRSYFLEFVKTSMRGSLTAAEQKNVAIFKELFMRVDRDIRTFRTVLTAAVNISQTFKLENNSFIYALKNISLSDHFTHFIDFARRRNPIIPKDSPLHLFLALALNILHLAFNRTTLEKMENEKKSQRQYLMEQFNKLKVDMSENFIRTDFSMVFDREKSKETASDLDCFNRDDDEIDEFTMKRSSPTPSIIEFAPPLPPKTTYAAGGILKLLDNGDSELDLQSLDSLVMNKIGPAVIRGITDVDNELSRGMSKHFNRISLNETDKEEDIPKVTECKIHDNTNNNSVIIDKPDEQPHLYPNVIIQNMKDPEIVDVYNDYRILPTSRNDDVLNIECNDTFAIPVAVPKQNEYAIGENDDRSHSEKYTSQESINTLITESKLKGLDSHVDINEYGSGVILNNIKDIDIIKNRPSVHFNIPNTLAIVDFASKNIN